MRASSSSVGSFCTSPSSTTPQWPCEVYSHRHTSVIDQQLLARRADGAHRLLHDAVVGVALGADRVLGRGQPEQDHAADPELLDLLRLARHLVDRQVVAAGQRRDLAPEPLAGRDEQRVDQVRGRQRASRAPSRAAAHRAAAAAAARRESHVYSSSSPKKNRSRAALAAEDPSVLALPAVHADPLEADRALLQRRLFIALLAVDADRRHGCVRKYSTRPGAGPVS